MKKDRSVAIVIPARYESSRLPGKPLIDLCGKTMIQRTWEQCQELNVPVYVATENKQIEEHVKSFGGEVVMTSSHCLTGTDRLAEANKILDYDLIINVQGDEPIINPADIEAVLKLALEIPGEIVNGMAPILTIEELQSPTIPKVAFGCDNSLLYMSRSVIPGSKSKDFHFGFKQICIYAFSREHLQFFAENPLKSRFEEVEDIEILRFVEHGYKVRMVELSGSSMAVDVESDVERVIQKIKSMYG